MRLALGTLLLLTSLPLRAQQPELIPRTLQLSPQKSITLSLPRALAINVALTGLHCPRFFARSPDGRLFVADLYDRSDNSKGSLVILDGWDPQTHTFARATPYLENLRNPNNLAFYTDPATHQSWLYTAFTDRLVRYRYHAGDRHPTSAPEVLAHYPDYGLNYKYGGWHLTRTVAFAPLHGRTRLYVTVGSSCDACREKEPIRATLSVMDPDGQHQQILASGLRNAVGVAYVPQIDGGALFATNMGTDHLGTASPEDTVLELDAANGRPASAAINYGWPTCFILNGTAHPDPAVSSPPPNQHLPGTNGSPPTQYDCSRVPPPWATFPAHSSPLGLAYFHGDDRLLDNSFLVALHGPSRSAIGSGYRVVRLARRTDGKSPIPEPVILGFLAESGGKVVVHGRPCGLFRFAADSFLLTDDLNGAIYAVSPSHESHDNATARLE